MVVDLISISLGLTDMQLNPKRRTLTGGHCNVRINR